MHKIFRMRLGLTAVALIGLLAVAALARPTVAQDTMGTPDASPEAMTDCTEALGIGEAGQACINIVHASPDAPAVDVYVDGTAAVENLPFGEATGWVALPAGDHQVDVAATGSDIGTAVISAAVTLEAGTAYEVAAVGLLASIAPAINTVELGDLADDTARIRVVHASPDAPAVDVAVTGGDILVPDLAFPNASDYLEVPADSYDLEVRPTGTTDVALPLPGVQLEAGMVYSFYAIGQVADGTLTVLPVVSSTTGAMATPEATPSM